MDTYKITSTLTLMGGVRYDFLGTVDETRGRFAAFDPSQGLVSASQLPDGEIYDAPKRNFGPRVGLAWQAPASLIPGNQLVVRAGYGIYFDTSPLNNFVGLSQNPIGSTGGFMINPTAPIPFDEGVPIFGTGAPQPPFDVNNIAHNQKTPNTQTWNLSLQQELSRKVVLQVGYVGNKSTHQLQLLDINQPTPGDPDTALCAVHSTPNLQICARSTRFLRSGGRTITLCRLRCGLPTFTDCPCRSHLPGPTISIQPQR